MPSATRLAAMQAKAGLPATGKLPVPDEIIAQEEAETAARRARKATAKTPKPVKEAKPAKIAKAPAVIAPKSDPAATKARVEAEKGAAQAKSMKALEPIAKEVNTRFEKAAKLDGQSDDHRLAAALRLEDARKEAEKVGLNFKKWVEENIVGQSYETVRKLVAVAQAPVPALALADMRTKNKEASKKHRAKTAASRDTSKPAAPTASPFKRADEALSALDDKTSLELLKSRAGKIGMAVVSETAAKLATPGIGATPVDAVVAAFMALAPREKTDAAFLIAEAIGMKLTSAL